MIPQDVQEHHEYMRNGTMEQAKGNYAAAMELFTKALPLSMDGEAEFAIASLYYQGHGVEKNDIESMKWMFRAARKRQRDAMFNVGCWYDGAGGKEHENKKRAARWFYRAAKAGNGMAAHNLGCLYFNGMGVEKNLRKAEYVCLSAVGKKQSDVYDLLGMIYGQRFDETGKAIDFLRAEYWLKKAIASGNGALIAYDKQNLALLYSLAEEKMKQLWCCR